VPGVVLTTSQEQNCRCLCSPGNTGNLATCNLSPRARQVISQPPPCLDTVTDNEGRSLNHGVRYRQSCIVRHYLVGDLPISTGRNKQIKFTVSASHPYRHFQFLCLIFIVLRHKLHMTDKHSDPIILKLEPLTHWTYPLYILAHYLFNIRFNIFPYKPTPDIGCK